MEIEENRRDSPWVDSHLDGCEGPWDPWVVSPCDQKHILLGLLTATWWDKG